VAADGVLFLVPLYLFVFLTVVRDAVRGRGGEWIKIKRKGE